MESVTDQQERKHLAEAFRCDRTLQIEIAQHAQAIGIARKDRFPIWLLCSVPLSGVPRDEYQAPPHDERPTGDGGGDDVPGAGKGRQGERSRIQEGLDEPRKTFQNRLSQARTVLAHSSDLAQAVLAGSKFLDAAYDEARKAKRQLDAKDAAKTQRAANIRRRMKRSAGDCNHESPDAENPEPGDTREA
jgi:hypothetical protein